MEPAVQNQLADVHVDQLLRLYADEWWTKHRTADDVRRMLGATDVLVALVDVEDDRLIGFARAITDHVYIAVILDVIVAADRRGRGLGRVLMDALLADPTLANVNSIELVCQPDLEPFYAQWGFTADVGGSRLMRRASIDPK